MVDGAASRRGIATTPAGTLRSTAGGERLPRRRSPSSGASPSVARLPSGVDWRPRHLIRRSRLFKAPTTTKASARAFFSSPLLVQKCCEALPSHFRFASNRRLVSRVEVHLGCLRLVDRRASMTDIAPRRVLCAALPRTQRTDSVRGRATHEAPDEESRRPPISDTGEMPLSDARRLVGASGLPGPPVSPLPMRKVPRL